ncbi:MAG: magnesium/cobalt transporter CorA [Rhodovibrionaceae bacterium]
MAAQKRNPTRLSGPGFRKPPPGSAPGTLVPTEGAEPTRIRAIGYGAERIVEHEDVAVAELARLRAEQPVCWIDVRGLADVETLRGIGELFGLHPLALEDIVHVHQRPKIEFYDDHLILFCRMLHAGDSLRGEQLVIVLAKSLVVTFQERPGDCLEPVRTRLRGAKGRIRAAGADYLAYAIFDAVIDSYFPLLEAFGERVETLESEVLTDPQPATLGRIHTLKRELMELRRAVWPKREVVNALLRDETKLVGADTHVYFRDCYDHIVQLMEFSESYREIATGLSETYLSSVSTRMNEVMKVLTIIATIFIPLGFIAGVYGMNFNSAASPFNMPELDWYLGYPLALGLMLAVAVGLLVYFRRKGWIGGGAGK